MTSFTVFLFSRLFIPLEFVFVLLVCSGWSFGAFHAEIQTCLIYIDIYNKTWLPHGPNQPQACLQLQEPNPTRAVTLEPVLACCTIRGPNSHFLDLHAHCACSVSANTLLMFPSCREQREKQHWPTVMSFKWPAMVLGPLRGKVKGQSQVQNSTFKVRA